jgi:hypothetical protein|tara:strand:+ start:620 stop:802 length:183 start_codon:yes stop_codon:yes gene_type:complete
MAKKSELEAEIVDLKAQIEQLAHGDWNNCNGPTCTTIRETQGSHTEVITVDDLLAAATNK